MTAEVDELTELAYEGSGLPLTTTPVVGTAVREYAPDDRFTE
jgi:ribonuclease Z